jgi:hypothetical protein
MPFFKRTRATFRNAEFGFFGVIVNTRVQVPDACGQPFNAGDFVFEASFLRHFRTSWLTVGNTLLPDVLLNWVPETKKYPD